MSARVPLVIVAAVGRNGAIGQAGKLPWRMPTDLAHFRDLTMGKPMIMGRRTFESIGKALPGRETIVVSRDGKLPLPSGVHRAASPEGALVLGEARAEAMGADEISLIGGATLFETMMDRTARLYMTFVDIEPEADTFFPPIDAAIWRESSRHVPERQQKDEAACVFVDYVRR